MALSDDLRERVVKAVVEEGMSRNAAARRFGVGIASAVRLVARFEATGNVSASPMGGDRRSQRIEVHRDYLIGLNRRQPDMTLPDQQGEFDRGHQAQQFRAPFDRAFWARRQVPRLTCAKIAKAHRQNGDLARVIENRGVDAHPGAKAFAARIVEEGMPVSCTHRPGACPAINILAARSIWNIGRGPNSK